MSWGAHGAMGELKSPLGMMASAALFPLASGHSVLGVPAIMPFAGVLAAALFPVTLGHSVLGVPCSLLLFLCYWWPVLLSGVAALWILVTRLPSSDAVRRASA